MQKLELIALHTLPVLLVLVLNSLLWKHNLVLLLLYLLTAGGLILGGRDTRVEARVFVYGVAMGFVIETFGTQLAGYQKFLNPDVGGIPLWLVVAWGYAFVAMKRISLIITKDSPWTSR